MKTKYKFKIIEHEWKLYKIKTIIQNTNIKLLNINVKYTI